MPFLCNHIQLGLPTWVKYNFCLKVLDSALRHHSKQYRKHLQIVKYLQMNIMINQYFYPALIIVVFCGSCQMSMPRGRVLRTWIFPCLLLPLFKAKFMCSLPSACFSTWGETKEEVRNYTECVPSLSSSLSEDHRSGCTNIRFFDCTLSFVILCSFLFFHGVKQWSIYMVVSLEHFLPALWRASSSLFCLFTHSSISFSPFEVKNESKRSL